MSSPSTFECFGLVIHGYTWSEVRARLQDALSHGRQTWIVTANPEILLAAHRDARYWETLRQADMRLVDGKGLQIVGWFFHANAKRLTGVDLAEHLLNESNERGWKVAFLGGGMGVAERAARRMRQKYPRASVVAEEGGIVSGDGAGDATNEEALHRLTLFAPDVLLVAFGHPKQEAWILRHLAALPSVKVAAGIGGTLDYWADTARRAPSFIRSAGLEWLWRLFREPRRWKRIWNAVCAFPWAVLRSRGN